MFEKFDPSRTMYLQGFDRRGAAASLWGATSNSVNVSGVFKDFADFAVVVLWDADNLFESQQFRYLPDLDLSGVILTFDLNYNSQLQDIGSIRNPWIQWDSLAWQSDTSSGVVKLVDHAEVVAGSLTAASANWTLTGTPNAFSEISFFYRNIEFTHFGAGSLTSIRDSIVAQISNYPWSTESPALALRAVPVSTASLEVFAAQYGTVSTSGVNVGWNSGYKFKTLFVGDTIRIDGTDYTIATIPSATTLTLTASAGTLSGVEYLANFRGDDGNYVEVRQTSKDSSLQTVGSVARGSRLCNDKFFTGGSSNCTWRVSIDFTALGIDDIRRCWLTLAPKIANVAYTGTNWDITITNIGTNVSTELTLSGNGTVRVGSIDRWCKYTGNWSTLQGFYYRGFARITANYLAKIEVTYSCQFTHDLYLGAIFGIGRGIFQVDHPVAGITSVNTGIAFSVDTATRRNCGTSIAAGTYTVTVTFVGGGGTAIFDYLEAVVPTTVITPVTPQYTDYCPAVDYGTDRTYKIAPQRLVWGLTNYGYGDRINEYISVFWHLERVRVAGTIPTVVLTVSGTYAIGDSVTLNFSGIGLTKTLTRLDTDTGNDPFAHQSLTDTFRDWINSTFAGVYAETPSVDVINVYSRTALFSFTHSSSSVGGSISDVGDLLQGSEGIWQIDDTAAQAINNGATKWHEDFFAECVANGFNVTSAISMEYLNPPEVWSAYYNNGIRVLTATGFGTEGECAIVSASNTTPPVLEIPAHGYSSGDSINSTNAVYGGTYTIDVVDADNVELRNVVGSGSTGRNGVTRRNLKTTHCAFNPDVAAYSGQVLTEIAQMQAAAGMVPRLQFGEFLWWFFSSDTTAIDTLSNAGGFLKINTSIPHNIGAGETILLCGITNLTQTTAAATSVTSLSVTADVPWSPNYALAFLPTIRGGSMGFYDSTTKADALIALGVPLHVFNTQNDDITAYTADVVFLRDRIRDFMVALRTIVLAVVPTTEFEILHATDVSRSQMYLTLDNPYPQGGRVNGAVNWADDFQDPSTAPFEYVKIENLSWGVTYRVEEPIKHGLEFPYTAPNTWPKNKLTYLMPNFNPGCPQNLEFRLATDRNYPNVAIFALDHIDIFSWPFRKPTTQNNSMEG